MSENPKYCELCGSPLQPNSRYCPVCGEKIERDSFGDVASISEQPAAEVFASAVSQWVEAQPTVQAEPEIPNNSKPATVSEKSAGGQYVRTLPSDVSKLESEKAIDNIISDVPQPISQPKAVQANEILSDDQTPTNILPPPTAGYETPVELPEQTLSSRFEFAGSATLTENGIDRETKKNFAADFVRLLSGALAVVLALIVLGGLQSGISMVKMSPVRYDFGGFLTGLLEIVNSVATLLPALGLLLLCIRKEQNETDTLFCSVLIGSALIAFLSLVQSVILTLRGIAIGYAPGIDSQIAALAFCFLPIVLYALLCRAGERPMEERRIDEALKEVGNLPAVMSTILGSHPITTIPSTARSVCGSARPNGSTVQPLPQTPPQPQPSYTVQNPPQYGRAYPENVMPSGGAVQPTPQTLPKPQLSYAVQNPPQYGYDRQENGGSEQEYVPPQPAPVPIALQGLKTNRSILVYILLSIVTFGIYGWFFLHKLSKDVNAVCRGDGEETMDGALAILLSVLTFGIFGFYWYYKLGNRLQRNAPRYGLQFSENGSSVLLWQMIGLLLFGIGYFIGIHIIIKNTNALCVAYNQRLGLQ